MPGHGGDDERQQLGVRLADRQVRLRRAQARVLPELASGEALGGFGLTEPGSGSDAGAMRTTAVATATTGC